MAPSNKPRWPDFPALQAWLVSMAAGMTEAIGPQVSDLFVAAGSTGIETLSKNLNGNVLYLPMVVTPELARLFMSMQTERQRKANELKSDAYKRDMLNKDWLETGEAFKFDTSAKLFDGGHRGKAIIAADVPVRSLVVFGLQPEAALVVDSGRVRTMANMFTFHGEKYGQELQSVIPRLIAAEQGKWVSPARFITASHAEARDYLDKHPELMDIMTEAKRRTSGITRVPRVTTVPMAIALAVLSRLPARLQPEAREFIEQLTTGIGLESGSSVLALRNQYMQGAPASWRRAARRAEPGAFTIDEALALFFSAWNRRHELNVKTIRFIRPVNDANFPRPRPYGFMHD